MTVVSLRDLARKLNVAVSTVSRALHDSPRISSRLRSQIKAFARKAGYRPDPMLSALAHYRKGKSKVKSVAEIAWINHWSEPEKLRRLCEYDCYWRGAVEAAQRHGYRIEEYLWNDIGFPVRRLETTLLARNTHGILIPPHPDIALPWGELDWSPFCIVRFGYSISEPRTHIVTSNQVLNSRIAFNEIKKRGYERIGFVTSERMIRNTRVLEGVLSSQFPLPKNLRLPPLAFEKEQDEVKNRHQLESWLQRTNPDAVLTDVKLVRSWIEQAGYAVPKDIGVAVMSILDGGADAGIDQQPVAIGRAASEVLIYQKNNHDRGIPSVFRETTIEGRWKNGNSLPLRGST
jgi:LacI family transcriptional regulator